ncbi:MAG: NUDIX hydrolase [Candidatus Nanoarchaeia archaeon]|jgi:ADP-ribose pyrophosphatase YjhB (NUDIX family)|nr:NUDIX hydrolase [Candidatus Nanoarchaeia archaeon]|tara:strand:+ start:7915 stop:8322 length:408 start_codon:yes stop_codon:yes gene_type:complete
MKDHVALLIKNNNKFLFIKRSKHKKTLPNIWAVPSGNLEDEKDIYQTAKREAYKELGIKIKTNSLLVIKELPEFKVRLHFLICDIVSGEPIIKDFKEISELEWLTFSEFFDKFNDNEVGHGLIYLRKNPKIWKNC